MSYEYADDVLGDIEFPHDPVDEYKIPDQVGRSYGQEVDDNDLISVFSAVEIIEHKHKYIVEGINFKNGGEYKKYSVKKEEHIQIIDTASFES